MYFYPIAKIESMKDITCYIRLLITRLWSYRIIMLSLLFMFPVFRDMTLSAQAPDPAASILELKEGYLIVRIPTYKAKIDTLTAMAKRTTDQDNKKRLQKQLQQAIEERDTLFADYISAFKYQYQFSKVAYLFDYDARDLNTATYFNLDGEMLAVADLSEGPLFYIHFDRTSESQLDGLVIYNRYLKKIPAPFPNDFTRGGINFLFLRISDKKFPAWRVGKINKQLFKYWEEINWAKSKSQGTP